jgi:uncharacterized repeat protein (TIGR02543 family)
MRLKLLLITIALFVGCWTGYGQSIFSNPITGTNPNTANPFTTSQTKDANITVSGIGRGSGISGAIANNRYNASGWSTGALNANDYFEFTLTPNSGYKINMVSFVYSGQVSTGTPSFAFRSSVDSYAANIGTANETGTTISLSAASYQNLTGAITFRFYAYGLAATGTTYSINDFTFNGTVTASGKTVTFNANGGSGTMSDQTASTATNLTANAFTRTGYTFTGWNTAANGSGTAYSNEENYPFTANATLYAQWTAIGSSTVIFDANSGTGTMANQTANTATALITNAFTRLGYTFAGWATTAVGTVAYSDSASYPFSANTTLYAIWTPNNNTITFDGNGFTSGSTTTQTIATTATATLTANGFIRASYTFNGWNTLANGTGTNYTDGASYTMGTTNVTMYAKWTANNYTITFNGNGSTGGSTAAQTIASGATAALTTNGFTKTGYTFDGWTTSAGGTVAYIDGANYTMGPTDATLYAKWVVYTGPCLSEGFDGGTSVPTDWTFTSIGGTYTTPANYNVSSPSLQMNATSDRIETPTVSGASELSFWIKGQGTDAASALLVEGYNGSSWVTIQNITNSLPTTGTTYTFNSSTSPTLISGIIKFRFTYTRGAAGNLAFDDVKVYCNPSCTPTVTTPTSTLITSTTATLGGNITSIGCSTVTTIGIEWSTSSGFANGSGTTVSISGSFTTGVFTQAVTGLPSGAVIYYKAFATNGDGTGYSGQASFTTTITNDLCSGATGLTVNAAAKVAMMTGSTATTPFTEKDVWFSFMPTCSGTHNIKVTGFSGDIDIELYSTACPTSTAFLDNSSGTTTTETITGSLTAGTIYYLRVLAWNAAAETTAFTAQITTNSSLTIDNTGSPAAGLIISGTTNVVVMGFTTTPNCATGYNLTGVTITKTGTSTTSDISNLRIFYDANSNGVIDGGETAVTGTGVALTGTMVFTLSGQTGITNTRNYLLVADVAVSAIGGNTFIGKITTSANLTAVLSPTGTVTGNAAGNTQTITYAGPEINVTNNTPSSIPTGSIASTGYNTQFAATAIGSSTAAKTYRIYNLGSTTLNVSAVTSNSTEFTVTSSTPYAIAPGAYVTFTVIFSPSNSGTRTAVISIVNNDITNAENPYTFNVKGDGTCVATTNTITPTSGPVGTEVTINSAADLTGATVAFNGVSATVVQISLNQIKVVVPTSATSGNLVTTNAIGCSSTNAFTVIKNLGNSCEGGSLASDLFMSEVTDSNYGGLTYIEIYNGTGVTKNLSGYSINIASNGGAYSGTPLTLNNVNLATGTTYVIALGDDDLCTSPGGDGSLAAQGIPNLGINFDPYQNTSPAKGNDHIALFNGANQIDSWGVFGDPSWATSTLSIFATETDGATFRRKNTATLPSTTYNNSDWDIIDYVGTNKADCSSNDYSDIGIYNFISGTPPTVALPSYTATCKTATLTVSGTEGYNGSSPADTKELAYQWLVAAPNATGWTEITDNANYTGSSSATLSIANISTVINYQYYCQIRENTNTCYTASNAVKVIDGTITWNGTDWKDINNAITTPSLSKLAVINADYDTTTNGDLNACSIIVNAGKLLTVTKEKFVTIQNDLTINATGKLEVLDKGSLVMINDLGTVTNNGTTNILRATTTFEKYDYVYWSTPIALDPNPTNIEATFISYVPNSTDWRIDNAYQFNPANYVDVNPIDGFDDNHDDWNFTTTMDPGKGYIIMVPEPQQITDPPVTSALVIFSGKVNNGVVTTPVDLTPAVVPAVADDDFNLVGNPYPSAISADEFIKANISGTGTINKTIDGTLYFWTHKKDIEAASINAGPDAFNYSQDDYAVYTLSGGIGTSGSLINGTEQSNRPNGYIASGQGFFVEAATAGTITFNNAMRVGLPSTANSQFYKSRPGKSKIASKDRIWLNLENSLGMFSQQLVGYFDNTTLGYDNGYDGLLSDGGNYVNFYSFIDDKTYKIQGRSTFDENDQVKLGYFSAVAGTFNINIDSKEGVFTSLSTPVYLEDKLLNVIFDLKTAPYTFTTEKGTFNDRFILRYTNKTLGTADLETLEKQVLVSNKNKQIKVNSAVETIDKVLVYDLLGRQIYKKEKVNSNELTIPNLVSSQQTLLVKVSLQNSQTVTKKIIF